MRRIRLGGAAVAACLALLLAACGGGDDALEGGTQPNEQSSVTVGSTNFSEQLILAQMYAAVLEKAGVQVEVRPNLGAREVVFPALEKGEIDLLPEYNGSVLSFLKTDATETTADEVNAALTPLLDAGGPLTTSALNKGDIDVGRVFTTQGAISDNGWVLLEEDKPLQPAQNIVPIGRKDAMTEQVTSTLNALAPKITTEELTKLNKLVDVDKQDPEKVANDWLTQQGLL